MLKDHLILTRTLGEEAF